MDKEVLKSKISDAIINSQYNNEYGVTDFDLLIEICARDLVAYSEEKNKELQKKNDDYVELLDEWEIERKSLESEIKELKDKLVIAEEALSEANKKIINIGHIPCQHKHITSEFMGNGFLRICNDCKEII